MATLNNDKIAKTSTRKVDTKELNARKKEIKRALKDLKADMETLGKLIEHISTIDKVTVDNAEEWDKEADRLQDQLKLIEIWG